MNKNGTADCKMHIAKSISNQQSALCNSTGRRWVAPLSSIARSVIRQSARRTTSWAGMMMVVVAAVGLAAQAPPAPPPPGTVNVEADPIRCWWRTSASAVRVGEPFSLILTCAIVENDTTTVVPDQARLDPAAMQLPPFEVVGGQREPDLRGDQRRFFQYQYRLRLISEELFGKDVKIPTVQINYHLESRVERGESVRGRDRTYILPSESMRVLSLVPGDATDIRDAPSWTFGDIEAQRFRSRVFMMAGGVLFTAAALLVLVALFKYLRRYRQQGVVARRLLSDGAMVRGVGREVRAVRRASERGGWTPELASRALAAYRVAGSLALGRPVSQQPARGGANSLDGQLTMRGGWFMTKKALVSGSATAEALASELRRGVGSNAHRRCLESLQTALTRFTGALFGRDPRLDETTLAESIADAPGILRRLTIETLWVVRKMKAMTQAAGGVNNRAWPGKV
jgi:hypothetical protein